MTTSLQPLPRCCPRHTDWQTLTDHLCRDFPSVGPETVLRGVLEARSVSAAFEVDLADQLDTVELMVRYRLMLTTGEIADAARTDPQTHHVGPPAPRQSEEETEEPEEVC